jgi:superfamily II DNA helicase RecQ
MRAELIADLLKDPARRPAIVYAPARKRAEELASQLGHVCRAAAYHAGLPSEIREHVQQSFQSGELDCVVATIAFGMGIDKADVRTVIHAALPATLEGYYQEIGRAGRDGLPSRAILMHSYADQRTHDFFLKRDYPPIDDVKKVYQALTAEPRPLDEIRESLSREIDEETFSKAIEKLFIHGGALVDYANNASRGEQNWSAPYTRQSDHRRTQLDLVQKFVDGHQCRMAALVLHFGDLQDGQVRCGLCDFCSPSDSSAQNYRDASASERNSLQTILDSLKNSAGKSIGRLLKELPGSLSRKELDTYLSALAKAGLLTVEDAEWIKDGETILFRRVSLTPEGEEHDAALSLTFQLPAATSNPTGSHKPAKKSSPKSLSKPAPALAELSPEAQELEHALKGWRTAMAKKLGMPPFVVLHDRTLRSIASTRPTTPNQLQEISGMGPTKVDKYGEELLRICGMKFMN